MHIYIRNFILGGKHLKTSKNLCNLSALLLSHVHVAFFTTFETSAHKHIYMFSLVVP